MLTVPGYRISTCIYESRVSLLYRGVRETDDLPIVLKVLKQDYPNTDELNRYRQEYAITQSIKLDGVVRTYGLETYQNTLIILLEDFAGESLANQMREPREAGKSIPSLEEFLWIATQTTAVLAEIHSAGIIHKDINPANIVYNPYEKKLKSLTLALPRVSTSTPGLPVWTRPDSAGGLFSDVRGRSPRHSFQDWPIVAQQDPPGATGGAYL